MKLKSSCLSFQAPEVLDYPMSKSSKFFLVLYIVCFLLRFPAGGGIPLIPGGGGIPPNGIELIIDEGGGII